MPFVFALRIAMNNKRLAEALRQIGTRRKFQQEGTARGLLR